MKKIFPIILILVLTVALGAGCAGGTSAINVKTAEAEMKTIETSVEISGVLLPEESVNISAKISGKVNTADFEVGDTVTKGQLLIGLDTAEISAQLSAAQAAYNSTVAQVNQAKIPMDTAATDLARTRALFDEGAASQLQLDQATAAYQSAKALYDAAGSSGLAQAKAAIDSAGAQMANTKITSPIDGVIVTKNIHAGEMVSPGVTLASAADISQLKLKGTISQELFPYLKKDQDVEIYIDAFSGNVYHGVISLLGPVSVGTGSYFPIELTTENAGDITAGLSAHSTIPVKGNSGVTVPREAVVKDGAEAYVFVISDGKASLRTVRTGLSNPQDIEITEGLKAGEIVATTNVNVLSDGMAVKPVD